MRILGFEDLMQRAVEAAGGDRADLAAYLGLNPNSVRQWFIGLSLPRGEHEDKLGALLGLDARQVRAILREEAMRRWEVSRARPPMGPAGRPVVPLRKPTPTRRPAGRRSGKLAVYLLAVSSAVALGQPLRAEAARPITMPADARPDRGILSRRRAA